MKTYRTTAGLTTLFFVFSLTACGSSRGQVLESKLYTKNNWNITVTSYGERGMIVPGAFYVFESTPEGLGSKEVITFRHDDPVPIGNARVEFLSEDIAWIYMGWQFAVTVDSGKTWQVWDAKKNLKGWVCCNYSLIKDVKIDANGRGHMDCDIISIERGEVPRLLTNDFGRTWQSP